EHLEIIPRRKKDLVLPVKAERRDAVDVRRFLAASKEHLNRVAIVGVRIRGSAIRFTQNIEVVMAAVGGAIAGLSQSGSSNCQADRDNYYVFHLYCTVSTVFPVKPLTAAPGNGVL